MYTSVCIRVLSARRAPIEGHVINLCAHGICTELDETLRPGEAVTIEFSISGLGQLRGESWPTYAVTAEALRQDNVDDFPHGPYRVAFRFLKAPSILQAQIARFGAAQRLNLRNQPAPMAVQRV